MNKIFAKVALCTIGALMTASCSMLDKEPLDQVSPSQFYTDAAQLSSFTLNYYPTIFLSASGWGAGVASWDDGTDNQASSSPNRQLFHQEEWKVGSNGTIGFDAIRNVNWFLTNVLPKYEAGAIQGDQTLVKAYIGEAYLIRAGLYFDRLKTYGDYPIVTEPLTDDDELLKTSARRMPRNEVARFILQDLDRAIALLPEGVHANKQRVNQAVARLLKSRVALYEGTFEKYHKGSGRVPGDANWPGKDKAWNAGKTFNIDTEVNYFLDVAIEEAKKVADAHPLATNSGVLDPSTSPSGWNQYYDMFASGNPSGISEVLLWRQYGRENNLMHNTSNRLAEGGNTGWTRGLVESFLMENGLPIYADAADYQGDRTLTAVKAKRDHRLRLFLFDETTKRKFDDSTPFTSPNLFGIVEVRDVTGYRQRKHYNYDPAFNQPGGLSDHTATVVFRSSEAYLNYIEAYYVRHNNLDADARKYWKALRERAGITAELEVTINATKMDYEANTSRDAYDWGAFSAGQAVDATLYSIRRERRSEFAGEGRRLDDLIRWRSMDQVRNYQIEGFNLWDEMYTYKYRSTAGELKVTTMSSTDASALNTPSDGSSVALVSSKALSKYLRPYQIVQANNDMYNGYTFYQAHYLSPFSVLEMQLASPTGDAANSNLYQNIGWPTSGGTSAEF